MELRYFYFYTFPTVSKCFNTSAETTPPQTTLDNNQQSCGMGISIYPCFKSIFHSNNTFKSAFYGISISSSKIRDFTLKNVYLGRFHEILITTPWDFFNFLTKRHFEWWFYCRLIFCILIFNSFCITNQKNNQNRLFYSFWTLQGWVKMPIFSRNFSFLEFKNRMIYVGDMPCNSAFFASSFVSICGQVFANIRKKWNFFLTILGIFLKLEK